MTHQQPQHVGEGRSLAHLHLWQIQPVRDVLLIVVVVALVYVGYLMRIVTAPLLAGIMLAYLMEPIVGRIARRTGRTAAALMVIVAAVLFIGVPLLALLGLAVAQGVGFLGRLQQNFPRIRERLAEWRERAEELLGMVPGVDGAAATNGEAAASAADTSQQFDVLALLERWLTENQQAFATTVMEGGKSAILIGWNVVGTIGYLAFTVLFLVPFFFFFASVGLGRLLSLGESVIPVARRSETITLLRKMDRVISGFVRGRIVIAMILAVLFTIGWWVIGVPAPLIFGPLTGLLAAAPYVALVCWPTAIVALWVSQSGAPEPMAMWKIILYPTIVYWSIQMIEDYVLNPLIQGKTTGLDTPTILVAVLGAGALAGVYGVLIAIPLAACIKILVTDVFWPRYIAWVEGRTKDPLPLG